jgi:hypothetical protein
VRRGGGAVGRVRAFLKVVGPSHTPKDNRPHAIDAVSNCTLHRCERALLGSSASRFSIAFFLELFRRPIVVGHLSHFLVPIRQGYERSREADTKERTHEIEDEERGDSDA